MRNFSKYIRGYKAETVLAPLFKLFEATLELIVPLIIASIIDKGIGNGGNTPYIVKMSLLLVLLGAVGLAFSVTAQYFAAKASVGYATRLRSSLFAHLQTLSYTEIDTLGTSTMVTRMTADANQVQTGLNLTLRLLLRSPFVVFGAMIMAFTINLRSAITFAVVIPALAVVVFGIMLISMPLYKRVQSNTDRVLKKTKENLSGARVIRAFCREEIEIEEFNENAELLNCSQKFVGKISALMNPITYVLINLAIIWLMHVGALEVNSGIITQGEVVALYNYMSQILVELIKLAMLIITISKALASADRIDAVFEVTSSQKWGSEKEGVGSAYAVELTDVSLQYKNSGAPSLSGISFKIKKGETVGVIGGTGSGKTSLINLIPRFYDATEGAVLVDGADVRTYDREALSDKIGIVPQKAVLFSGTLRENMLWGNKNATDEEITRALEISEAADFTLEKGGLDFKIEEGGKNLSGGQKQRLTIARALVKNSEILILDDSASALDYATDARLRASIKQYSNGRTVFIVSQRASSVMNADKIIVLDDGEITDIGTHNKLLEKSSVYQEIYTSQFRREGV
jgi:ABC-type multidrug transport system fused ATPase/permease subunit